MKVAPAEGVLEELDEVRYLRKKKKLNWCIVCKYSLSLAKFQKISKTRNVKRVYR